MLPHPMSGELPVQERRISASRATVWVRALRLPFYPMLWLGYTLGASLAVPLQELWKLPAYWWGYAVVFLIEALTVFLNDIHDYESARRNLNHGRFTVGSRVLVEGLLTPADLKRGYRLGAAAAVIASLMVHHYSPAPAGMNVAFLALAVILGGEYTVPPLKFSHRGLGEIVVAFVHSLLIVQCGAAVLGGRFGGSPVVKVALPLLFAVFPSIALSGLPDREADGAAGKAILAVKLGPRPVLALASLSAFVACSLLFHGSGKWPSWAFGAVTLHASSVIASCLRQWTGTHTRRIDGVMVITLSFFYCGSWSCRSSKTWNSGVLLSVPHQAISASFLSGLRDHARPFAKVSRLPKPVDMTSQRRRSSSATRACLKTTEE
ncbi:prenyltransferase [Luteolibacter sp. GHJ8]|uniref:Prenyltransferase n=1 Tax=Luteolibacter rhizosphaerae TaxID=2989719 RepID=A0ABT3FZB8_9BACT|nr:prenyltransferase [Luteolibacter rhizosphaerae]MCW1912943.1 prenyltransferase [Luteolibacter rhizosphaerae]